MKIGITINDYYKQYLEKIAKVNNISFTRVCGLIVQNFLSYNHKKKVLPIFSPDVRLSFVKDHIPDVTYFEDEQLKDLSNPEDCDKTWEELLEILESD